MQRVVSTVSCVNVYRSTKSEDTTYHVCTLRLYSSRLGLSLCSTPDSRQHSVKARCPSASEPAMMLCEAGNSILRLSKSVG